MPKTRPETRIVTKAQRIVASEGLDALTISRIASDAGTSVKQVYEHFGSREELIHHLFDLGWEIIQKSVWMRLLKLTEEPPEGGSEVHKLKKDMEAVLNGVLDAFEADKMAVSATVIIGFFTMKRSERPALRERGSFRAYLLLAKRLERRIAASINAEHSSDTAAEAAELMELLFGAVQRRLFLLTPLYSADARAGLENREVLIRVLIKMVDGVLTSTT